MKFALYVFSLLVSGSFAFVPMSKTGFSTKPHLTANPSIRPSQHSLLARRPLLSEDDLATPPNPKVIEVVEKMGGTNVIASGK